MASSPPTTTNTGIPGSAGTPRHRCTTAPPSRSASNARPPSTRPTPRTPTGSTTGHTHPNSPTKRGSTSQPSRHRPSQFDLTTTVAGGIPVDVAPVGASLAVTLDTPPQEVDTLVDVGDLRLLFRQAQTHRSEYRRCLVAHADRMLAGAGHEQQPVVCVPDQTVVGLPMPFAFSPLDRVGTWSAGNPGDVLVQHRQGHVG